MPEAGKSFPLGATVAPHGTNFSIFAKHSTAAQLLLFDGVDDAAPSRVIDLDPYVNRTYHYWHVFVPGVAAGQVYGLPHRRPFRSGERASVRPAKGVARPLRQMPRSAEGAQQERGSRAR